MNVSKLKKNILLLEEAYFEDIALKIFRFQAAHNPIYKKYIDYLRLRIDDIKKISQIPFLPIRFFKTQKVLCKGLQATRVFESSGTTGSERSSHYIADEFFYRAVSEQIFKSFYGPLADYHIFALLPSYLERSNASLVYMTEYFMRKSTQPSGFYLNNTDDLLKQLQVLANTNKKVLLIGVTFALLDLAASDNINLSHVIVMETGGMKGRKKQMIRQEVHEILKKKLNVTNIHAEYGMTEILSQCYSLGDEIFYPPPWCKVLLREINDPFSVSQKNQRGGINIIDLANIDSCSFIATQDIGIHCNGRGFKVVGRFDYADLRGCNLMVA